jgi:hypothetical protein
VGCINQLLRNSIQMSGIFSAEQRWATMPPSQWPSSHPMILGDSVTGATKSPLVIGWQFGVKPRVQRRRRGAVLVANDEVYRWQPRQLNVSRLRVAR